jgi:hypothetical protein
MNELQRQPLQAKVLSFNSHGKPLLQDELSWDIIFGTVEFRDETLER